jgi:hypothetical protein
MTARVLNLPPFEEFGGGDDRVMTIPLMGMDMEANQGAIALF